MKRIAIYLCLCLIFSLETASSRAETLYTVMDLGHLYAPPFYAYTSTHAAAMNDAGQVTGWSCATDGFEKHAFRTAPNAPIRRADDLGTAGGHYSEGFAINASGVVVGMTTPSGDNHVGFRSVPGSAVQILPGTRDALAINDAGQVIGRYWNATLGAGRGFRTAPNAPFNPETDDLGTLGGNVFFVNGINAIGQVVGSSEISGPLPSGPPNWN